MGEWMSLDPTAENYYRNSDTYKSLAISGDKAATVVPEYDPTIECRDYPHKITPENMKQTTFKFKAAGDFTNYDKMYFYIWDETNGAQVDNNGQWWTNVDFWGSKSISVSEIDGKAGIYEYSVPIPDDHRVYLIVQAYHSQAYHSYYQTCNIILTNAADGDTLYITGNMLENPVDSTQFTIEAKFEKTEECGPAKVVTSTCKVVGTVLNADPAKMLAQALASYYVDTENWTRENVKAAEAALGLTDDDVKIALYNVEGRTPSEIAAASELLADKNSDTDSDKYTTDSERQSDNYKDSDTVIIKDTETDKSTDLHSDTDIVSKNESDTEKSTDTSSNSDTEADTRSDSDIKENTDTHSDSDVKKDTESDRKNDTDSDRKNDTDSENYTKDQTDSSAKNDSETDTSTESDTDNSTDTVTDNETKVNSDTETDNNTEKSTDNKADVSSDTKTDDQSDSDSDEDNETDSDIDIIYGDVDEDGDLTSNDALSILRASSGMITLNKRKLLAADFDHDGEVTSADAINVLRESTIRL